MPDDLSLAITQAEQALEARLLVFHPWTVDTRTTLAAMGITTWGALAASSPASLLFNKNFGKVRLREVSSAMELYGVTFRSGPREPEDCAAWLWAESPGVYLLQAGPFVKIGCASQLRRRIAQINDSCPYPVRVAGWYVVESTRDAYSAERDLHHRFSAHRVRREWFQWNDEIKALADSAECGRSSL